MTDWQFLGLVAARIVRKLKKNIKSFAGSKSYRLYLQTLS